MPVQTGATIGPYKVDREIGRGGMGVVFLARDTRLGRTVALKALPDDVASDPDRLERFEREARVLASLNHPNIAAIYGLEESQGRRYLAPARNRRPCQGRPLSPSLPPAMPWRRLRKPPSQSSGPNLRRGRVLSERFGGDDIRRVGSRICRAHARGGPDRRGPTRAVA